jgi:hypothetical protein
MHGEENLDHPLMYENEGEQFINPEEDNWSMEVCDSAEDLEERKAMTCEFEENKQCESIISEQGELLQGLIGKTWAQFPVAFV